MIVRHLVAGWVLGWLAITLLPAAATAQGPPEQKVHRAEFEPAGDRIYEVLKMFYELDESLPLDTKTVEEWETENSRNEKIVYTTQSGERVPGYLFVPKGNEGPHPCVLLLHGLGNGKDRWWESDREGLPNGLLTAGIAVFAIDLQLHGERTQPNDYQSPVYLTFGNDLHVRARDMSIQSTLDSRRALSMLRARDDIDANRVAVLGYSMGGMIAIRLAALEPELRGVVGCAVPMLAQPMPTDPFEFAPHVRASALLQIGRTDWLSSPEDAETLLALLPSSDKQLILYEAGHQLPEAFTTDALSWLESRLE